MSASPCSTSSTPQRQQQVPSHRCSASLLSPTVVLTAAHCTVGTVAARVWFDEDVSTNPEYPFSGATSYDGDTETNPAFCNPCGSGLHQFALGDVGVIVLSEPVPTRCGRRVRRPSSCGARRHAEEQVRGRLRGLRSAVPAQIPGQRTAATTAVLPLGGPRVRALRIERARVRELHAERPAHEVRAESRWRPAESASATREGQTCSAGRKPSSRSTRTSRT